MQVKCAAIGIHCPAPHWQVPFLRIIALFEPYLTELFDSGNVKTSLVVVAPPAGSVQVRAWVPC